MKKKTKRFNVKVHDRYDKKRRRTIDLMAKNKKDAIIKVRRMYSDLVIDKIIIIK